MNPTPTEAAARGVRIAPPEEAGPASPVAANGQSALVREPEKIPPQRQLPPGGSKISRISQHTKSLVEDVSAWVELKLKLTQIEMEERIDARINQIATQAIAGVLAALGGFFLLMTLALGISAVLIWLDLSAPLSYTLGFGIVALLLVGAALVMRRSQRGLVSVGDKTARIEEEKLTMPHAHSEADPGAR